MTPLELLAVGVIVVLVWLAGFWFRQWDRDDDDRALYAASPLMVGVLLIGWSLLWIVGLGIKEAAK